MVTRPSPRVRAKSGQRIKDQGHSLSRGSTKATTSRGNGGKATNAKESKNKIIQGSNNVSGSRGCQVTSIFMEGDITTIMEFIFNSPMTTVQVEQTFRGSKGRG